MNNKFQAKLVTRLAFLIFSRSKLKRKSSLIIFHMIVFFEVALSISVIFCSFFLRCGYSFDTMEEWGDLTVG